MRFVHCLAKIYLMHKGGSPLIGRGASLQISFDLVSLKRRFLEGRASTAAAEEVLCCKAEQGSNVSVVPCATYR